MIIKYIDPFTNVWYFKTDNDFGLDRPAVEIARILEEVKETLSWPLRNDEIEDLTIRALSGPATERRSGPVAPIEKEQYSEYQPELQVRKTISVLQLMR